MRWILPFIACVFAALLPWRLRHLFIKALAYWMQALYFLYGKVLKALLRNLDNGGGAGE